jgi:hypothetical protein
VHSERIWERFCFIFDFGYLSWIPYLVRAASCNGIDVYVHYLSAPPAAVLDSRISNREDLLIFKFGARSRCLVVKSGNLLASSRIAKHRCHWLWPPGSADPERLKSRSVPLHAYFNTTYSLYPSVLTHPHPQSDSPIRVGETDRKRS